MSTRPLTGTGSTPVTTPPEGRGTVVAPRGDAGGDKAVRLASIAQPGRVTVVSGDMDAMRRQWELLNRGRLAG